MPGDNYQLCLKEAKKHFLSSSNFIIIDAGCDINPINHGSLDNFTQLAINIFGSESIKHIYGFDPVNYETYEETYKDNPRVTTVRKALSRENGSAEFYVAVSHGLSSLVHRPIFDIDGRLNDKIEVETITVDDFMKEQNLDHVDYLKLDVEGGELDALKGAAEALKNHKITFVQFEHGSTFGDAGYSYEDVDKYLKNSGYKELLRVGSEALYMINILV